MTGDFGTTSPGPDWKTAGGWAPHRCPHCGEKFPILKRMKWVFKYGEVAYGRYGHSNRWAGHAARSRHISDCLGIIDPNQTTLALYTGALSRK